MRASHSFNIAWFWWTSPLILSFLIIGVIAFIFFVRVEKKSRFPLVPFTIFQNQNVLTANIITFFLYFALTGLIFFVVLNLQQMQHYSPIEAGLALLPPIIIMTFFTGMGGVIADKYGSRLPLSLGAFIVGVGMVLLIIPADKVNYWWDIMPGLLLFGYGMSLAIAPVTKSALSVDESLAGTASGINNAVARVAGLFAIAMLGAFAVTRFSHVLVVLLHNSSLDVDQQKVIFSQSYKLAEIQIPESFSMEIKNNVQRIITHSFIDSYRIVIGVCAVFSFISAFVAWAKIDRR